MQEVVDSPALSRPQVVDLLCTAVPASFAGEAQARNFVQLLVENHRVSCLPEIAVQFTALKNAREGASDALITSAFPLDAAEVAELVAGLERKFSRKLKPTVVVDPALIGGVRVTVGDEVLDSSVRARLNSMQAALTA